LWIEIGISNYEKENYSSLSLSLSLGIYPTIMVLKGIYNPLKVIFDVM
jgi:hypothetical protein